MPVVEAALGRSLVACSLALALLASGCATLRGEGEPIAPDPALASCDAESAARLRFLEPRLAAQARYAGRWWWTWNAVYVGGIGYGAAAAGFGDELHRAARQAHEERRSWRAHVGNLALNLAGAIVVAEGFDEGSGWGSGALGIVVGEIRIWTYPWQAERALAEYERRFPRATGARPRWRTEIRDERQMLVLD